MLVAHLNVFGKLLHKTAVDVFDVILFFSWFMDGFPNNVVFNLLAILMNKELPIYYSENNHYH